MTATAFRPARPTSLVAILRPLLLLAAMAFFAGFGGYLILGPSHVMRTTATTPPVASVAAPITASAASEPAADDWNVPKKI